MRQAVKEILDEHKIEHVYEFERESCITYLMDINMLNFVFI